MRFCPAQLAQDPPFSRLDLISCCNVLIYLGAVLQRKVLSILHYALKPTGFLVLGPSESLGTLSDSFHQVREEPEDLSAGCPRQAPRLPDTKAAEPKAAWSLREGIAEGRTGMYMREADRLVLAEYAPPGAVIDDAMNIVQVRGRTAPYLELSPGEPNQNLLKMVREGLIAGLGKAIRTARRSNAVRQGGTACGSRGSGQFNEVTIKVIPFRESSSSKQRYFLILFEDTGAGPKPASTQGATTKHKTPKRDGEAPGCGWSLRPPRSICNRSSKKMQVPWRSSGPRTKRHKRAMRNWKPRKKNWNPPMKN